MSKSFKTGRNKYVDTCYACNCLVDPYQGHFMSFNRYDERVKLVRKWVVVCNKHYEIVYNELNR